MVGRVCAVVSSNAKRTEPEGIGRLTSARAYRVAGDETEHVVVGAGGMVVEAQHSKRTKGRMAEKVLQVVGLRHLGHVQAENEHGRISTNASRRERRLSSHVGSHDYQRSQRRQRYVSCHASTRTKTNVTNTNLAKTNDADESTIFYVRNHARGGEEKQIHLQASSVENRDRWIAAVNNAVKALRRKSGVTETKTKIDDDEETSRRALVERLTRYYQTYNPDKVEDVPDLARKYATNQDELFTALVAKYGPEPVAVAPSADEDDATRTKKVDTTRAPDETTT